MAFNLFHPFFIVSEIGVYINQFENDMQLCNWAGFAPANNESERKKKSICISKAGQYPKPLLVQCALVSEKKRMVILIKNIQESKREEDTRKLSLLLQE